MSNTSDLPGVVRGVQTVLIDPRVGHRGMGGLGYCVDCDSTTPGTLCAPKRAEHPRIWARESARLADTWRPWR